MERIEYKYVDKSKWGPGPWQDEPDKIQWEDEDTGLPCLVVRQPELGHLCGYVGVSEGHSFFGVEYSDCALPTAKPRGERPGDDVISFTGGKTPEWITKMQREQKICEVDGYCDHTPDSQLRVHGGITFSDYCSKLHETDQHGICHKPSPGEPEKVWWFGFDCAHFQDISPGMDRKTLDRYGRYKDVAYVQAECRDLARQLKALATDHH